MTKWQTQIKCLSQACDSRCCLVCSCFKYFIPLKWMPWVMCSDCVIWDGSPSAHRLPHIFPHTYTHTGFFSLCLFLVPAEWTEDRGRSLRLFRLASFRVIFTSLPLVPLSTVKDYSWDMTQAAGCWWCHLRAVDGIESRRRMTCQLHLTPCRDFQTLLTLLKSLRLFAIYPGLTWF